MKKIIAYKGYYREFMASLSDEERKKVYRVFALFDNPDLIPHHYIKYLEDAIHELRITLPTREARLLFTYDGETLVVLLNCFIKKTQKTPRAEIEKAKRLKKEYYESK